MLMQVCPWNNRDHISAMRPIILLLHRSMEVRSSFRGSGFFSGWTSF